MGPVLLISARGMLGRAFEAELRRRSTPFTVANRESVDLSRPESIKLAGNSNTEIVINCAAWTDVDGAEANEAAAKVVNGEGVRMLAERCAKIGARLITFGTDYVFSGKSISPYGTDQARDPVNAYGRSKAAGEVVLEASACDWLNIRTSWLYAPWGKNFVLTIRKLLFEKPSIKVVNDQRGRPTSAEHLARTTMALLDRGASGHWHATDGGECSWFEFAQEIGRLAGAPGRVEPCASAEFPRPAKRPAYSVLDISKTEALVGAMPRWQDNLADVMSRLVT